MYPNLELLKTAIEMIEDNPQHWDQEFWHCGTTHCLAGFVELIVRQLEPSTDADVCTILTPSKTREIAKEALRLTEREASDLFHQSNTIDDILMIYEELEEKVRLQVSLESRNVKYTLEEAKQEVSVSVNNF